MIGFQKSDWIVGSGSSLPSVRGADLSELDIGLSVVVPKVEAAGKRAAPKPSRPLGNDGGPFSRAALLGLQWQERGGPPVTRAHGAGPDRSRSSAVWRSTWKARPSSVSRDGVVCTVEAPCARLRSPG